MKKVLLDFLPIIAFFISFKLYGIFVATGVAICVTIFQISYSLFRREKISAQTWISLIIILLMGGATILLRNEWFIKWKPSVLYFIFSFILLFSLYVLKVNVFQKLIPDTVKIRQEVYAKLSNMWAIFFALLGLLNLYVAYNFDTETWVNFKMFGLLLLTFLFAFLQSFYIAKHIEE